MKLQVESLTDKVYNILKQKIIDKELPPGTRLVDSQLAEEYGISRTPMRDAIRKLAEDGLVTSYSNRGYCVFKPTQKDIEEIFEIRLMVDEMAVRKLVNEILPQNPEAVATFRQFYEDLHAPKETEFENDSFIQADEDFHDRMILLTGNTRLFAIYSENRSQTRMFRRITSNDKSRMAKANRHHEKICEGLLNLNLEQALTAVDEHIRLSMQDALTDFQE